MGRDRKMDRRSFWGAAFRGFAGAARKRVEQRLPGLKDGAAATPKRGRVPEPGRGVRGAMRPPGAVDPVTFLERCVPDCRMCVDACPRFAIVPSTLDGQPGGGDGRPYLMPDQAACDLCGLCMPACPTGALQVVAPMEVRIGIADFDAGCCVRTQGESCDICLERCPLPGVAIRDEGGLPTVIESACTGCGLCAEACPPHAFRVIARAS